MTKTLLIQKSANRKTGPLPVTYAERKTCPASCPHYLDDCYAEAFHTRLAWDRAAAEGVGVAGVVSFIQKMKLGQLWRHAVAGDLWGQGEHVDPLALGEVVRANIGRRGFTYTHKKSAQAIKWIRHANAWGFTVNLSADDAAEADRLADLNAGPVVCIVPADTKPGAKTPAGRPITICPAQLNEYMTCSVCELCQKADRRAIVGFLPHGNRAATTDARARRVVPIAAA